MPKITPLPHGRTQWDVMAEAISEGQSQTAKLALLIFVRYWPRTGIGGGTLFVIYKLIETLGHGH
jgi:hypothetical protein